MQERKDGEALLYKGKPAFRRLLWMHSEKISVLYILYPIS